MNALRNALLELVSESATWWTPRNVLIGILFLAGSASIVLANFHILPLSLGYVSFYSFLLFLGALYRPRFVLYALVVFLPFEIIFIGPRELSVDIRIYQWGALFLGLATLALMTQKKQGITMPPLSWFDGLLLLVVVGAFSAAESSAAFKQALIVLSFGLLYGLGRVWIQKGTDLLKLLPFVWTSSLIVLGYALFQSWQFTHGHQAYTAMIARPNSVFPEADWLGLYAALILGLSWFFLLRQDLKSRLTHTAVGFASGLLAGMILLLSVSRSAWLGFFCFAGVFGLGVLWRYRGNRGVWKMSALIGVQICLAFFLVFSLGLTTFKLTERLASTTGEQTITIACATPVTLQRIGSTDELASFGCQQINLEDIGRFQSEGLAIQEVSRPDPNVNVRRHIYETSLGLIRQHWLRGIGWGEAKTFLGTDAQGNGLNTSNMFLEVWLGSGLVGALGFGAYWILLGWLLLRQFLFSSSISFEIKDLSAWVLLSFWVMLTVFNLFNTGLLLGIFCGYLIAASWYLSKAAPSISKIWHE